jgi:hypothetical protein
MLCHQQAADSAKPVLHVHNGNAVLHITGSLPRMRDMPKEIGA